MTLHLSNIEPALPSTLTEALYIFENPEEPKPQAGMTWRHNLTVYQSTPTEREEADAPDFTDENLIKDPTRPADPGGEDPGGEDPGGEDPGGEDPGGETPGGEDPGGEDPGGEDPGGEDPGGEDPGTLEGEYIIPPDEEGNVEAKYKILAGAAICAHGHLMDVDGSIKDAESRYYPVDAGEGCYQDFLANCNLVIVAALKLVYMGPETDPYETSRITIKIQDNDKPERYIEQVVDVNSLSVTTLAFHYPVYISESDNIAIQNYLYEGGTTQWSKTDSISVLIGIHRTYINDGVHNLSPTMKTQKGEGYAWNLRNDTTPQLSLWAGKATLENG